MWRYLVFVDSLLCLTLLVGNGTIYQFTMICMNSEFNSMEQSIILATISVGCIMGSFPTVKLMNSIGFTWTFTAVGTVSALSIMLVPLAEGCFVVLLVNQIIQGMALACVFLALGVIPAACGDHHEKGLIVSILSCSLQLGPSFIMPVAGLFCSSAHSWEGAYYISGTATLFAFVIFYFVYEKVAIDHMSISPARDSLEDPLIHNNNHENKQNKVPYRSILTSASFWGLMIAAFGDTVGYQLFLLYGPTYINTVLNCKIAETGLFAAIPHLVSMITKAFGGAILEKSTCIDDSLKVMFLICLPQLAMTICFAALTFITSETAFLGQAVLTVLTVFSGLEFIGVMSGCQIIGQQYTHIFTSAVAVQDSVAGLLVPGLVAVLAPNYEAHEWRVVFCFLVGLLLVSNASFLVLTRVEPAKWTKFEII